MLNKSQDYTEYENEYEKTEKEVLVLISDFSGGAVKIGDSWQSLEFILAYINVETSYLKIGEGQITWLLSEEQSREFGISWPYNFKTGTIYRLIVRELKDKTIPEGYLPSIANRLMVVKVLEENINNSDLLEILADYRKPILLNDNELGVFELNKDLRWFEGKVSWLNNTITIYLEVSVDNQKTWTKALSHLKKYWSQQTQFDIELKQYAAEQLIELANDWQEETSYKITINEFIKRISLSTLSISAGGKFKFDFLDDNIFLGHTIRVSGT
ncbi:MAG: DUF2262 domain-containing protein, partial [Bacteroidia bacterium]